MKWTLHDLWNLPVEYYETLFEMVKEQNEQEPSAVGIDDMDDLG